MDRELQEGGLSVFGRFHSRQGREDELATAIAEVVSLTRKEAACQGIDGFRDTRDRQLFFIHSRWAGEPAFEIHAKLAHTVRFLEAIEALVDHPLDVHRATPL